MDGRPRAARECRVGRMEVWIVERRVDVRRRVRVSRSDWPGERLEVIEGESDGRRESV